MITFIIFCIVFGICTFISNIKLPKSSIGKQIERLLKKITPNNQEIIKSEINALLDSYKEEKSHEFTDTLCSINQNEKLIKNQIYQIECQISDIKSNMKNVSDEIGARLLYQKEKLEVCHKKLYETLDTLTKQRNEIDSKLNKFLTEFLCKKAEIATLIVVNPLNTNTSNIDIQLNKLINEFKDLEFRKETENMVNQKMNNIEEVKDEDYNEAEYIKKFKNQKFSN